MNLRRKVAVGIPRASETKKLEASSGRRSGLPTAAVVAAMLAMSAGVVACSGAEASDVRSDPAVRKIHSTTQGLSTDGTASASATPTVIDPEPRALPGEMSIVVPTPPPSATTPPSPPPVKPIVKPIRHGGKPIMVSPSHGTF